MNVFQKATNALRAVAMQFVGSRAGWLFLNRARFNYAKEVGDGSANSIVVACVSWLCRTFPEAPLQIMERAKDGTEAPNPQHPAQLLLEAPNPYYSAELLWRATIADFVQSGNAYWLKVRNGAGQVIQLWWTPQHLMQPIWPVDGSEYISYYEYKPNATAVCYAVQDVVHFRMGLDPSNTRKGLSPLASLLREVFTDDEAASYSASLLRNMGVPGVIISPDSDMGIITSDDAKVIKADFKSRFSGENRGEPMVISGKTKIETLSFNPQQMDLRVLRKVPEERISAVLGVPAIVAGLGAGLDRSTFANMSEAREMAYESTVIPHQRLLAGDLKAQLLPDFGDTANLRVAFDLSKVRVLQEDQTRIWTRVDTAVRGGWMMVSRAKELVGETPEPTDGVYLRGMAILEVTPGQPDTTVPVVQPTKAFKARHNAEAKRSIVYGSKEHGRVWSRWIRRLDTYTRMLTGPVQDLLKSQQADVLDGINADNPFDREKWEKAFVKDCRPVIGEIAQQAGDAALGDMGLTMAFDVFNPAVVEFLNQRAQRFAEAVNETTWERLKKALADGLADGESIEELAARVKDIMGDRIRSTPETIARTEAIGAANGGTLEAWEQSDIVESKMWIAALDDRTRDSHTEAHGQTVALDEDFHVGDGDGPAPGQIGLPEEDICCRCCMNSVLREG